MSLREKFSDIALFGIKQKGIGKFFIDQQVQDVCYLHSSIECQLIDYHTFAKNTNKFEFYKIVKQYCEEEIKFFYNLNNLQLYVSQVFIRANNFLH